MNIPVTPFMWIMAVLPICLLLVLMVGADSIRDVIAFPKVKDASCLMMEAPNVVDPKQLDELGIAIVENNEQ